MPNPGQVENPKGQAQNIKYVLHEGKDRKNDGLLYQMLVIIRQYNWMQPLVLDGVYFGTFISTNILTMKKVTIITSILALFCATTIFAQKETETRSLSGFTKISLGGGFASLTFKAGDQEGVYLSSKGASLKKVKTSIKGESLNIEYEDNYCKNCNDISIVVTCRDLKAISTSGSTDIFTDGVFKADKFVLNSSGSSDFNGELDVKELEINVSGSTDITLKGKATDQHYAISGSGDINADELWGETAKVAISGSGDVSLNIDGNVKSAVSGSGDVSNRSRRSN